MYSLPANIGVIIRLKPKAGALKSKALIRRHSLAILKIDITTNSADYALTTIATVHLLLRDREAPWKLQPTRQTARKDLELAL